MTFTRHGEVSKAFRDSLRSISAEDYKELEISCVEALVNGEPDIILALPYTCKLPKGFPKGVRVKEEGPVNFYRIKVKRMLEWLNEKGQSIITVDMIRVQSGLLTRLENTLEKEFV